MVKFFAVNIHTGRVEGFESESARDTYVQCEYGRAISVADAKSLMRSHVLNFAASKSNNLLRETISLAISESENATERLYYFYQNAGELITHFLN